MSKKTDTAGEQPITSKLVLTKETKGAVRYDTEGDFSSVPVGNVYIRKDFLDEPYPQEITVSITPN